MEIYIKAFKKRFNVKASNKNMRKVYEQQLKMAKIDAANDTDADTDITETFKNNLAVIDSTEDFITTTLKLTAKQRDALEDLDQAETVDMANHISMRLLGMSEKDIKEANEPEAEEAGGQEKK